MGGKGCKEKKGLVAQTSSCKSRSTETCSFVHTELRLLCHAWLVCPWLHLFKQ